MMRVLMLVCVDPEPDKEDGPDIEEWVAKYDAAGIRIDGDRLQGPSDATVVRVRQGNTLVSDGPYAESKEWIAGYDLLEVKDWDEAIAVAAAHPMAYGGRIVLHETWPLNL
jgi:hypothetical protein